MFVYLFSCLNQTYHALQEMTFMIFLSLSIYWVEKALKTRLFKEIFQLIEETEKVWNIIQVNWNMLIKTVATLKNKLLKNLKLKFNKEIFLVHLTKCRVCHSSVWKLIVKRVFFFFALQRVKDELNFFEIPFLPTCWKGTRRLMMASKCKTQICMNMMVKRYLGKKFV